MRELPLSIAQRTEILLIMTMPIHISLKQLITVRRTLSHSEQLSSYFYILILCHPLNYHGYNLKGFRQTFV